MTLEILKQRGSLRRTRGAIEAGKLTVGFLGGSITDPRVGYNWPEPVIAWLVDHYPNVRFTVENAAIGATGSDSAVFRVQRDIIDHDCDLVFVEYAVNDGGMEPVLRAQIREGLLRKLLKTGVDVVIVYTFGSDMFAAMDAGTVPESIADFELLAEHYALSSVWMGLHAYNQLKSGLMRWYEWLPDNLHPQYRGSQVYADSVNAFLESALNEDGAAARTISVPNAVDSLSWESACAISIDKMELTGPWTIRRWTSHAWIEKSIETSAPGARLKAAFHGRVLWLGFDFGKRSADFRWRIDDGDWVDVKLERPEWCGDAGGWYRSYLVSHELASGPHVFEIETVYNALPGCNGTDFKIGLIGQVTD